MPTNRPMFQNILQRSDLKRYNTFGLATVFWLLFLISLGVRYYLVPGRTFDYINFLKPWLNYLQVHGLHSFGTDFANYNTPYLLLLWVGSYLPLPNIAVVKGISFTFDIFLAYTVYLTVRHFRPGGNVKFAAALGTLYLPTAFINSGLWGQCDGIYTAFLILSFYFCLIGKLHWSWAVWGVAIAFKLQAIFMLPFLAFMLLHRRTALSGPLLAGIVFILLSIFPVLEGRSLASVIGIYFEQTKPPDGVELLSWNAPTFYEWMPDGYFKAIRKAGIMFAAGVSICIAGLAFRIRRFTDYELLLLFTLTLFIVPFFLPQIHERYFYPAEIASLILAFVQPRLSYLAIAMQVVTLMSFRIYFTGGSQQPFISLPILAIAVLTIICTLAWMLHRSLTLESGETADA